jgi:sialidase-1
MLLLARLLLLLLLLLMLLMPASSVKNKLAMYESVVFANSHNPGGVYSNTTADCCSNPVRGSLPCQFRIPVVVSINDIVLAFAEGRPGAAQPKRGCHDGSGQSVWMRKSVDGGRRWGAHRAIANDTDPWHVAMGDGVVLGAALHQPTTSTTFLFYTTCYRKCVAQNQTANSFVISSKDLGETWSQPTNLTRTMLESGVHMMQWGEGLGVRIRVPAASMAPDMLLVCGWWRRPVAGGPVSGKDSGVVCIGSHDNGANWAVTGILPGKVNEVGLARQPNGSVLLNMRSSAGIKARLQSRSDDGGKTFLTPWIVEELPDPINNGGLTTMPSGVIALTHDATINGRMNMSVFTSTNGGGSWHGNGVLWAGPSAYSTVTPLREDLLGVLYERGPARDDNEPPSTGAYENITFAAVHLSHSEFQKAAAMQQQSAKAAAPPEFLAGLVEQMHPKRPGNVALFLQPDNRTGVYFASSYTKSASTMYTASVDGRTFAKPVHQPVGGVKFPSDPGVVRRWDGSKWLVVSRRMYEVPQVVTADGWANLLFQMYPLGLRSARAVWNATTGRYDWPAMTVTVTTTVDGGISRPCIRLRHHDGRLFHIGGDGISDAKIGGGILGAFSDDNGASWRFSATNASVPASPHCLAKHTGACGGGTEAMTVELSDGVLWMLIRSPGGGNQTAETSTVWQTFSDDGGQTFRGNATPTTFITHASPVLVLRLANAVNWMVAAGFKPPTTAPILVVWTNNRQGPGRKVNEASRMLLHAAISFDNARTFHGHREIMRDPLAKVSISSSGAITDDYGVGYPSGVEQADGSVIIEAGQGDGRWGIIRLEPAWLLETTQTANFTSVAAAHAWNDTRNFSDGSFVSACAWDEIARPKPPPSPPGPMPPLPKESIGGGYLIDCATCKGGSGFFVQLNSSIAHPLLCDHSLPTCCSRGLCGRKDFSGCYRVFPDMWRRLTPPQFHSYFSVGSNFTCAMLTPPAEPALLQTFGKPSCAPFDGVSLRVPRLSPVSSQPALCVELERGKRQATAALNFPSGAAGNLSLRLAFELSGGSATTFGGAVFALSDHYAPPWTTRLAPSVSLFVLPMHNVTAEMGTSGVVLPRGLWVDMVLDWSIARGTMEWEVKGLAGAKGEAPLLRGLGSKTTGVAAAGSHEGAVSYFSLQSFGEGGVCVASITSQVVTAVVPERSLKTDDASWSVLPARESTLS